MGFLGGDCFHCYHFVHHPEAHFGKGVPVVKTNTFHEEEEGAREIIRETTKFKKGEGANALFELRVQTLWKGNGNFENLIALDSRIEFV